MELLHACPICGSAYSRLPAPSIAIGMAFFTEPFGLSRCHNGCGVRFVNPRPDNERLKAFYSADGYDCHNPMHGSEGDVRLCVISRYSHGTICDYGAGAGNLLAAAARQNRQVCGVEIGASARANLHAKGFHVVSDITELNVKPEVVSMVHVLEHTDSPRNTLIAIRESLARDGFIYIEVPNANSLRARLAESFLKPVWGHTPVRFLAYPIHLFYFHSRSLRHVVERAGFEILEMGTMGMGIEELFARKRANGAALANEAPPTPHPRPRRLP